MAAASPAPRIELAVLKMESSISPAVRCAASAASSSSGPASPVLLSWPTSASAVRVAPNSRMVEHADEERHRLVAMPAQVRALLGVGHVKLGEGGRVEL